MYRKWFDQFRKRDFKLKDKLLAEHPVETDENRIRNLINETRSLSVQEMSQMLNMSKSYVHRHLKKMGIMPKLNI